MTEKICECEPGCATPYGECHCGCGEKTTIVTHMARSRGQITGEPMRFIRGHANGTRHALTEIDDEQRTAVCSKCGEVTIKRNGDRWKCTTKLQARHRLTQVDPDARTAWCGACKETVDIVRYKREDDHQGKNWLCGPENRRRAQEYKDANREKVRDGHRAWREANAEHVRNEHLLRTYGISLEQYNEILAAQGGGCYICQAPPPGAASRKKFLHVDHDHACCPGANSCGKCVRFLLCDKCNVGLGSFRDDPLLLAQAIISLKPSPEQLAQVIALLEQAQQRAAHPLVQGTAH